MRKQHSERSRRLAKRFALIALAAAALAVLPGCWDEEDYEDCPFLSRAPIRSAETHPGA